MTVILRSIIHHNENREFIYIIGRTYPMHPYRNKALHYNFPHMKIYEIMFEHGPTNNNVTMKNIKILLKYITIYTTNNRLLKLLFFND